VPDDKNFALTPLMKPLLDYVTDPKTGELVKDSKTGDLTLRDPDPPVKAISVKVPGTKADYPASKGWQTGNMRSLEAWQDYYRKSLPDLGLSKSAAEDILTVLGRYDGMFAELRQDLQTHPLCRYPLHWELVIAMPFPHLSTLQSMVTVLALRASAELELNRPDKALADLQLAFQLIGSIRNELTLIDGLVRITTVSILLQPIWEGVASHRWNAEQLAALEKEMRVLDFLSDFDHCLRSERGMTNWLCEKLRNDPKWVGRSLAPLGYNMDVARPEFRASVYENQILINTIEQEKFLTIMDEKEGTVNVAHATAAGKAVEELEATPSTFLAKVMMPVYTSLANKFSRVQTYVNEAAIACEIERYRLAHGSLPQSLDALQMPGLPHDIINGQPLHYRVTGDDYLLYSVGWNETDDGGKIVLKPNTSAPDATQGDWVWSLKPLSP
jgi:hypothetical protein